VLRASLVVVAAFAFTACGEIHVHSSEPVDEWVAEAEPETEIEPETETETEPEPEPEPEPESEPAPAPESELEPEPEPESANVPTVQPVLPAGAPAPFEPVAHHIVVIADLSSWNSIRALSDAHANVLVTSQNKPADLPWGRWARNISVTWYETGDAMADAIADILTDPGGAPARVMVDELRSAEIDKVAACAARMRAVYPELAGRWGVYLVHGVNVAYPNLQPAIDELLLADAALVPEMYPARSQYCAAGANTLERDIWLGDYFRGSRGDFPQGRLHWLMSRRTALGSLSAVAPIFGVTDTFMTGTQPARFLDRMFYVWATRSGYRSLLLSENGGPGAYKWEHPHTSNTSRDLAFSTSYEHYGVTGSTSSRLGQVPCP
jgi:hypothetical protein